LLTIVRNVYLTSFLYQKSLYQIFLNMKRILTLLVLTALTLGVSLAQSLRSAGVASEKANTFGLLDRLSTAVPSTRTTACAPDTLIYAQYKNPSNLISGVGYANVGNNVSIAGQWYPAEQPITVNGVEFIGDVLTNTNYTVDVEVQVWNVGSDSIPVGTALATQVVTVDSSFAFSFATFSPPVQIAAGNGYAITLFTPEPDTGVAFRSNLIGDGEGQGEENAIVGFKPGGGAPAFFKSTALTVGGNPYDVDMFIFPHVQYSINADFTGPTDCIPQNTEVQFTNTSSPVTTSRYYNRFEAFRAFINPMSPIETFQWVPLAGDTTVSGADPLSYTFSDGSTSYDVNLDVFQLFMTGNFACFDDSTITFTSGSPAVADFSADADTSLTVPFTDASVGADSVRYSFGDPGNSVSSDPNPTFTYASYGTFQVIQIAFGPCGNDTLQSNITITEPDTMTSGVTQLAAASLRIFPNPSEGRFTVEVSEDAPMTLRVFNLVGQEILHQVATRQTVLDLSSAQAGIYFLQGEVAGKRFSQRLIVE
jgi:hypothetical protein